MEILSRPQITTLDNQPAFIQVGQRVPRVTGSNVNQIGISNTVELENVGLILGVTPRVSPEGMVVMEVDAEKSEVAPVADGIPISVAADGTPILSPRVDITTAQTTVSAADGETIILGGLITRGTQTTERRVPYLSDIPIAGRLFRFDSKSMRRTELLIILTPQVIRGQEDMERLKQIESARMSWCAADLHRLHGDTGMCHRENCPICDAGTLVVYPDMNPRGIPLESVPTPEEGSLEMEQPAWQDLPSKELSPLPESQRRWQGLEWNDGAESAQPLPSFATASGTPSPFPENDPQFLFPSQPLPGHKLEQQWGEYVTRVSNKDPRQDSDHQSANYHETVPSNQAPAATAESATGIWGRPGAAALPSWPTRQD